MQRMFLALVAIVFSTPVFAVQDHSQHQHSQSAEQTVYVCPMHSQIVEDGPGSCPICGMDLVARSTAAATESDPESTDHLHAGGAAQPSFEVTRREQQALRVTTASVERKNLQPMLSAQAQVSWQESAQYHVHSRAEGWVEELYADVEGQWVEQGEKLYRVYAPDLVVAQDDYLQLLESLTQVGDQQNQQEFKRRGQQRLRLLGMNEKQISELEKSGKVRYEVDYFAPQAGYLTALNIQQGMYVNPGLELMTISGDQQLWFLLDIPVRYADQVAVGQMAHISSASVDGHWMNTIDYLYPRLDQQTQTLTARVPVQASINDLREGLWATAKVELEPLQDVLVIPVSSLIQVQQSNRVVVRQGDRDFVVKAVKTGLRVGDEIEITSGLTEGEQVVTNGQFMLDSEASLRGLLPGQEQNERTEQQDSAGHAHGGH
ncbi:efflux RND transporter periplasmic adaptor subunit [Idiomarina seosinensis]|uniref:efflux RND transporter periplasmic adaptor subunit n=1 Tax=Idiomarina seosinensis TaxID=281739 RepID=UPI00384C7466